MGYSKHELSTINMFSTPLKNCYITPLPSHSGNLSTTGAFFCPQSGLCEEVRLYLFRERLSEKLCTRQSRKASWDMINTQFLAMQMSNLLLLLSFSTRKHMSQGSQQIFKQEVITDKVGGSSAKPEVSKQSKEKRLKHKVSGYKSESKRRSIAGCRLLLRTLMSMASRAILSNFFEKQ